MGAGEANSVREWLVQTGLRHHAAAFAGVTEEQFRGLMMQDYGKFGIVDMDDKQKLFRLTKRLNTDPTRSDRGLQTPRLSNSRAPAKDSGVDSLEAKLRAQMLDGNAALLSLADDSDDYLLQAGTPQRGYREQSPSLAMSPQAASPIVLPPEEPNLPKIRVVVRKRPLNRKTGRAPNASLLWGTTGIKLNGDGHHWIVKAQSGLTAHERQEEDRGEEDSIDAVMAEARLTVHEPRVKVDLTKYVEHHAFAFDDVLDEEVTNDAVYRSTVQPLVATIFRTGKATCFAYGQTGSGKTYTMQPLPLRAAADIFRYLSLRESQGLALWVSCFEIYGGKLYDLLNGRQQLVMREDGKGRVCIVGLKEVQVSQPEMIQELVSHASKARSTGSTGVNDESSRSHSIMQFALKRESDSDGHPVGKISFIDLAGSERGADTYDNNRQTRMEGAQINKSLLALKECIRALDASAHHVPFRGSKLTEVLRDSFTGDQARTVMIANVSPASSSCEHTLNTLRYADRVKELRKDKTARFSCAMPQRAASPPPRPMLSPNQAPGASASPAVRARHASLAYTASPQRNATPPRGAAVPEVMPSPRPGQRQVAPPLKARRGTVGTLDDAKLGAAKRSAAAAEDGLARLAGRHDDSQQQAWGRQDAADDMPNQGPTGKEAALKALSRRATADEVRSKAGEGPKRNLGFEAADVSSQADTDMLSKSTGGSEADLCEMLGARDELMNRILEEEDNLIAAHRWQIEETMAIVRQEMTLLGQIDQPGSAIDAYIGRLRDVLERKASNIAQLQGRLESFQAQLRDEEELSNLISAKMHMRSDPPAFRQTREAL